MTRVRPCHRRSMTRTQAQPGSSGSDTRPSSAARALQTPSADAWVVRPCRRRRGLPTQETHWHPPRPRAGSFQPLTRPTDVGRHHSLSRAWPLCMGEASPLQNCPDRLAGVLSPTPTRVHFRAQWQSPSTADVFAHPWPVRARRAAAASGDYHAAASVVVSAKLRTEYS